MSFRQLFVGLFTEGTTDIRFLEPVVEKTLNQIASEIEFLVIPIEIIKTGLSFNQQVLTASKKAFEEDGISILCVQADADARSLEDTLEYKITPARILLEEQSETEYCKTLVAIIPIQETEAWMLADKDLLKTQLGTTLSDTDLGIQKAPESTANPKEVIENAIRIAREGETKRRRNDFSISALYSPIGEKIELEKLETLPSFQHFKENLINAFRKLNYLH